MHLTIDQRHATMQPMITRLRRRRERPEPFTFIQAGGLWRPRLDSPARLRDLLTLDDARWAAISVPVAGLHFDATTLAFLDADGDGRIRCDELRAAIRWFFNVLRDTPAAWTAEQELSLAALNRDTPEGRAVHAAARRILRNTGRTESEPLALPDVLDRKRVLDAAGSNGDGVITPQSMAGESGLAATVAAIIATLGPVRDLSGQDGVDATRIDAFYTALRAYRDWFDTGWAPDTAIHPNLTAFPPEVLPAAAAAWKAVRADIDAYFALADVVRYDPRAARVINAREQEWAALDGRAPADLHALLARCPAAPVSGTDTLLFDGPVNPVFRSALDRFRHAVWRPLYPLLTHGMSAAEWRHLCRLFDAYDQRIAACRGAAVEPLGIARIRDLIDADDRDRLLEAVARDAKAAGEIAAIAGVEKLLRFKQHLLAFANNFAALPDFYDPTRQAAFEAGALVMDGRRFTLCVQVEHPADHAAVAARAGIYLLYCELTRPDAPAPRRVAVAVTDGGTGALYPGKRGVFTDREGRAWDARVTAITANPISLAEAVWAPFKRLGTVITSQFEKLTTAREKHIEKEMDSGFTQVASAVDAGPATATASPAPEAARPQAWGLGGAVVGGSVAIAALGSSFAFISRTFSEIGRINFLYTAAVLVLIVLVPTILLALLRLHARDIGKILEACGWAINGRMRLTMRLARLLSVTPPLPPRARKRRAPRPLKIAAPPP